MARHTWDPTHYLRYAGERGRPFVELIARVDAQAPGRVVDLGCGPGNLTALLAQRWPQAAVVGLDRSSAMIEAARRDHGAVEFEVGDIRTWSPPEPVDVIVSNAALQWIPGHLDLLPRLVDALTPQGWLAIQVPGNFGQPSHTIRRDLATEAPWAAYTAGVATPDAPGAEVYLERLQALGLDVDAWETTYLHVLPVERGPDAVFDWVSGTGARPTIQAIPEADGLRAAFVAEFQRRLREAYPMGVAGVVLPFRRTFAVARRA